MFLSPQKCKFFQINFTQIDEYEFHTTECIVSSIFFVYRAVFHFIELNSIVRVLYEYNAMKSYGESLYE